LEIIPTDGSMWNMYAEPYHFNGRRVPMTKQCSYISAARRPGVPSISGFFGDPMNRGSLDRIEGKIECEIKGRAAGRLSSILHQQTHAGRGSICSIERFIQQSDERILAVLRRRFTD